MAEARFRPEASSPKRGLEGIARSNEAVSCSKARGIVYCFIIKIDDQLT